MSFLKQQWCGRSHLSSHKSNQVTRQSCSTRVRVISNSFKLISDFIQVECDSSHKFTKLLWDIAKSTRVIFESVAQPEWGRRSHASPATNLLNVFLWCFVLLSTFETKRKEYSDERQVTGPSRTKFLVAPLFRVNQNENIFRKRLCGSLATRRPKRNFTSSYYPYQMVHYFDTPYIP